MRLALTLVGLFGVAAAQFGPSPFSFAQSSVYSGQRPFGGPQFSAYSYSGPGGQVGFGGSQLFGGPFGGQPGFGGPFGGRPGFGGPQFFGFNGFGYPPPPPYSLLSALYNQFLRPDGQSPSQGGTPPANSGSQPNGQPQLALYEGMNQPDGLSGRASPTGSESDSALRQDTDGTEQSSKLTVESNLAPADCSVTETPADFPLAQTAQ